MQPYAMNPPQMPQVPAAVNIHVGPAPAAALLANTAKKIIALFTSIIAAASWAAFLATGGHPAALLSGVLFTFLTIVLLSPHHPRVHHIPAQMHHAPAYIPPMPPHVQVVHHEVLREVPLYMPSPPPPQVHVQREVVRERAVPMPMYIPPPQPQPQVIVHEVPVFAPLTVRVEEVHNDPPHLVSGRGATARGVVGGEYKAPHEVHQTVPEHKLVSHPGAHGRAVVGGDKK